MSNSQFPTARKTGLVVQEVPDEVLVYDLDANKAHCLNKTAAAVWQSCTGTNSVSDIAAILQKDTGNKISDEVVWLAIDQLNESNLLETEMKADFGGQTRRQVLKKIGMATIIALPIVASLAAPTSVYASTSCLCMNDVDCQIQAPNCPTQFCSTDNICDAPAPVAR